MLAPLSRVSVENLEGVLIAETPAARPSWRDTRPQAGVAWSLAASVSPPRADGNYALVLGSVAVDRAARLSRFNTHHASIVSVEVSRRGTGWWSAPRRSWFEKETAWRSMANALGFLWRNSLSVWLAPSPSDWPLFRVHQLIGTGQQFAFGFTPVKFGS